MTAILKIIFRIPSSQQNKGQVGSLRGSRWRSLDIFALRLSASNKAPVKVAQVANLVTRRPTFVDQTSHVLPQSSESIRTLSMVFLGVSSL